MFKKLFDFILRTIGPTVGKYAVEAFSKYAEVLISNVKDYLITVTEIRFKKAKQKAEEADIKAKESSDPSEAEINKRIAEVWKEVAEEYRIQLDETQELIQKLRREAQELMKPVSSEVQAEILSLPAPKSIPTEVLPPEQLYPADINIISQLERLSRLYENKHLTKKEYNQLKKILLSS